MTYFQFLGLFLVLPLGLLACLELQDYRRGRRLPGCFQTWRPWRLLVGLAAIAVLYTTPWDNYLVATRVWWYEPRLVCGVTLGWVPLEEYLFFVLQTLLTGMLWMQLARRLSPPATSFRARAAIRLAAVGVLLVLWMIAACVLAAGWAPGTYLGLEATWALIPLLVQAAFGADILWHYRRLTLIVITLPTLMLTAADAVALRAGTWTINPEQTLGWKLGGVVPLEEFFFFLLTNSLVACGMTLFLARESHARAGLGSVQAHKRKRQGRVRAERRER
jgi:lycopene cyclase domain-containing protein